jgi:hypothetical protein
MLEWWAGYQHCCCQDWGLHTKPAVFVPEANTGVLWNVEGALQQQTALVPIQEHEEIDSTTP